MGGPAAEISALAAAGVEGGLVAHVRQCGGVPGSRVCDRTQVRSRNCGVLVAAGVKNHFKQRSPYIVVHLLAPPASPGLVLV